MKNRNVGFLIVGIAVVMASLVLVFNAGMKSIIGQTCSEGPSCSMYSTLSTQTGISLAIVGVIFVIGLFLIFSKEHERTIIKKVKQTVESKRKPIDHSKLDKEEKTLVKALEEADGTMFQSDIVEKSGF